MSQTIDRNNLASIIARAEAKADEAAAAEAAFQAILADFQAKNPDAQVEPLTYSGGKMIVRTPDEGTYAQFIATSASDRTKTPQATSALCRRCILWPSVAVVDAIFSVKPGLPARIADKLLDKAGAGDEVTLGK